MGKVNSNICKKVENRASMNKDLAIIGCNVRN